MPVARAEPSGTRLITSTPPATTTSCWPDITACTAKSSACWLDPQARLTVVPGMCSGQPAASTEYRPMLLDWSPTWETQPHTTSSTIVGVDAGALDERVEHDRGQVGGVHVGQAAVALADRGAHRLDDDGFTHPVCSDLRAHAHRPVNAVRASRRTPRTPPLSLR